MIHPTRSLPPDYAQDFHINKILSFYCTNVGLYMIAFTVPCRNCRYSSYCWFLCCDFVLDDFIRIIHGILLKIIMWSSNSRFYPYLPWLTHWGRVTHICVAELTIIGSDNGLSPGRRQAIIWTNAGILLIRPLWTNFNEILIEIHTFSFKKIHLKMSSGKWRPFCLGFNVLRPTLGSCPTFSEVSMIYEDR